MDAVFLDFLIQPALSDAQQVGGMALNEIRLLQCLDDNLLFHVSQGFI